MKLEIGVVYTRTNDRPSDYAKFAKILSFDPPVVSWQSPTTGKWNDSLLTAYPTLEEWAKGCRLGPLKQQIITEFYET